MTNAPADTYITALRRYLAQLEAYARQDSEGRDELLARLSALVEDMMDPASVSLGRAAAYLDVPETVLRDWADRGALHWADAHTGERLRTAGISDVAAAVKELRGRGRGWMEDLPRYLAGRRGRRGEAPL